MCIRDRGRTSLRWTPCSPRKWRQLCISQLEMARGHLNLGTTSLRWTPQQLSIAATVSQIAAP
eukprot:2353571-Pyramimonas_sp.AAC.1